MRLPKDLEPETKPIFESKTAAASAILMIAAFVPQARDYLATNPQASMIIIAAIGFALRLVTKGKVRLF